MSEDNGKTKEQLSNERLERYKADPESFVEDKDIIAIYFRTEKGHRYGVGRARKTELLMAKGELTFQIDKILTMLEIQAKPKIVTKSPKGAFGGIFRR